MPAQPSAEIGVVKVQKLRFFAIFCGARATSTLLVFLEVVLRFAHASGPAGRGFNFSGQGRALQDATCILSNLRAKQLAPTSLQSALPRATLRKARESLQAAHGVKCKLQGKKSSARSASCKQGVRHKLQVHGVKCKLQVQGVKCKLQCKESSAIDLQGVKTLLRAAGSKCKNPRFFAISAALARLQESAWSRCKAEVFLRFLRCSRESVRESALSLEGVSQMDSILPERLASSVQEMTSFCEGFEV